MKQKIKITGFTLIEVMLSMALVVIIVITTAPSLGRFLFAQEVPLVEDELVGSINKAKLFSLLGKNDASWGVALHSSKIILFQGDSYATRDQSFDENFGIFGRVSLSGFTEIVFAKRTGKPTTESTIVVSGNGVIDTFVVNSEGILEQQ